MKRYTWDDSGGVSEDEKGEYVKYDDCEERISILLGNYQTLQSISERQQSAMNQMSIDRSEYLTKILDLKGEVSKLKHRERTESSFMEIDTDMLYLLLNLANEINGMNDKKRERDD